MDRFACDWLRLAGATFAMDAPRNHGPGRMPYPHAIARYGVMTRPRRLSLLRSDGGMSQRHGADDVETSAAKFHSCCLHRSASGNDIVHDDRRPADQGSGYPATPQSAGHVPPPGGRGQLLLRPTQTHRGEGFSKGDTLGGPSRLAQQFRHRPPVGEPAARWDGDHEHGRAGARSEGVAARHPATSQREVRSQGNED